jgi:hypothetical protein
MNLQKNASPVAFGTLSQNTSYNSLATEVFQPYCVRCHSGPSAPAGLDLSTYAGVLRQITPFSPATSLIYTRVNDGSMPATGALPSEVSRAIYEWIRKGAPLDENPLPQPSQYLPQVNAGIDKVISLPTNSIQISATATDANGSIASYQWTKISGPNGAFVGQNTSQLTASSLTQGTYEFEVRAFDDFGESGFDRVQVIVNSVGNGAPLANAGPDRTITLPTNSATLNGSATDSDGSIVSYRWTKISGPSSSTISSPNNSSTAVNNLVEGIYIFQLSATDNGGSVGVDTVSVTVQAQVVPSTYSSLFSLIFESKCTRCHDSNMPSGQYSLMTYSSTMANVIPGNASESLLYQKILNNSMPKAGTPLTTQEKQAIADWINAGALNN